MWNLISLSVVSFTLGYVLYAQYCIAKEHQKDKDIIVRLEEQVKKRDVIIDIMVDLAVDLKEEEEDERLDQQYSELSIGPRRQAD